MSERSSDANSAGPRPGPRDPVRVTPPRVPGSVRRTATLDITFPDGIGGTVVACVRGRDLVTDGSGDAAVVDLLVLTAEIEPWTATLAAVDVDTASGSLDALSGTPLSGGYGRRLVELLPDDAARRSLAYSALEDLGAAYLVSGYAALRGGFIADAPEFTDLAVETQGDVCIGWARGGSVIGSMRATGKHAVPVGPAAPAVEGDDRLAWHELPVLEPIAVRRLRRTDVRRLPGESRRVLAQHHFRDSYLGVDGENVMHEYVVDATCDDTALLAVAVEARVLPWQECPGAVATAQQLVGAALDELATRARTELVGAAACTHLTSTLRMLADVRALSRTLPSAGQD